MPASPPTPVLPPSAPPSTAPPSQASAPEAGHGSIAHPAQPTPGADAVPTIKEEQSPKITSIEPLPEQSLVPSSAAQPAAEAGERRIDRMFWTKWYITYDEFVKFGRAAFSAKPGDVWNIQDIRDAWDVLPIVHHRHSHDDGWERGQVTELNPLELQASIIRLVKQRVEDQAQNTQWVKQPATQKLPGSRFGLFLKEGIDKELKAESVKIYNKII